jgi:cell shape-determining protein MreC
MKNGWTELAAENERLKAKLERNDKLAQRIIMALYNEIQRLRLLLGETEDEN